VLAVTGLLLLVSGPLNLTQIKIENALVSKIYGTASKTDPVGFKINEQQWVVMVDGLVYVGKADPVPLVPPLVGAYKQADGLIVFSNGEESVVTLEDGTLVERFVDHRFAMQKTQTLPQFVKDKALARYRGEGVAASRIILDIHTGSFFGALGPWIMGLASILLIALSISGIIMWANINRRKRKRAKSV